MNDKNRHLGEEDILKITKDSMNKTFGDLGMDSNFDSKNKGSFGGFVEENVFKYKANNDDNPDFIDAGIELKVTPIKRNKDGTFSSKERLVLNMINYKEEATKSFETCSFYHKNRRLLIWFYLYSVDLAAKDYTITNYDLFEFEKSSQFQILKRDWEIIHKKIVEGRAHELSESDTEFLAACCKGANGSKLTEQYNSNIKAKPRAYSLKPGFMTSLYRRIVHEIASYSPLISMDEWIKNPLEEIYKEKLSKFYGKTQSELKSLFKINSKAKQLNFILCQKMLRLSEKENATLEMNDVGMIFRTITLNKSGIPTEAMPFRTFDFTELINLPWEESTVREDFVDLKLMLFIFREIDNVITFEKVIFWNCPNSLVDGPIKKMYENCAELVKNGDAFYFDKKGKIIDKFPKEIRNSNHVCHVRPHTRNSKVHYPLPIQDKITGINSYTIQSFWFNKEYVMKIIRDCEKLDMFIN